MELNIHVRPSDGSLNLSDTTQTQEIRSSMVKKRYLVSRISVGKRQVSSVMSFVIEKRIDIDGRIPPVRQRNCIAVVVQNSVFPGLQLKPDVRCHLSCPQHEVQLQSLAPLWLLCQKPLAGRRLNERCVRYFVASQVHDLQRLYVLKISFGVSKFI